MHAVISQVSVWHKAMHTLTQTSAHTALPFQTSNCSSKTKFRGGLFNDGDFV